VKDSRPSDAMRVHSIRRRRHCQKCKHRFSTHEIEADSVSTRSLTDHILCARVAAMSLVDALGVIQAEELIIIKKDGE
jgi:transcription repressor NrdR-like protein